MKGSACGLLAGLMFWGCGGQPSTAPPAASAPPPSPPATASAQRTASTAQPRPQPKAETKAAPAIPREALLVGGQQPNFQVVAFAEAAEQNRFDVEPPQIGLDSTFLLLTDPPIEESSAPPRSLPAGFVPDPKWGTGRDGWPQRIVCEKDGASMVLVPAGLFLQGTDAGPPETGPKHVIELDAYYIDRHEVTLGQWQKYRDSLKADKKAAPAAPSNANGDLQLPVLGISWREAIQYLKWAGRELPTEAEWEKAARGEKGYEYPWGNGRPIWEGPRQPGMIGPVGAFRSDESVYGAIDLAGNAREWCQDWFLEEAYQAMASTAGVSIKNWAGPKTADKASRRVVKGGTDRWEVWSRSGLSMKETAPDIGFRGVLRLVANGLADPDPAAAGSEKDAPPPTVAPGETGRRPPPTVTPPRKTGF